MVVVGYLGHFDVRLARRLWPNRPIVLDQLAFAADTAVDRRARSRVLVNLLERVDRDAMAAADLVVLDTEESMELLPKGAEHKTVVVTVGSPSAWYKPPKLGPSGPMRVVFFGLYTPLQGAPVIGRAIALLTGVDVEFTMIGRGQDMDATRTLALPNRRVTWLDWVGADQLADVVASHDVCLGIFGTGPKGGRVVPNKVYQGAAAGCAVITSNTPVQRAALADAAIYVAPGDAGALAAAIYRLGDNPRQLWVAEMCGLRTCQHLLSTGSGGDAFAQSPRALDPSPIGIPLEPVIVELVEGGPIESRGSFAGPAASLPTQSMRCWSNEQPIDRRLNEAGAEVEVAGGVGLEADLQAACAFACEPIEAVRQQHAGEAASLVVVLDAHRFEESDQRRVVEPEQRVAGDLAIRVLDRQIERRIVQRALSQPRLDQFTVASDHRVRTIRACHAIDDREPIDLRDRRALVGVHPCGARQLVGHRESTLDGEARQRRVVLAHEHLECLAPMSGGGFQRRGPDVFLVDDRRHGEDVCLPGVAPGRQPCSRHRADLVEPDRERQLVGRPGAAPPPLHVGGLPHAAERISQASALQDRGRRVQPSETPQQLASHDHVGQAYRPGDEAGHAPEAARLCQRYTTGFACRPRPMKMTPSRFC